MYYKVMARLKIRFTKLGHELCEKCRIAEVHFKSSGHRSNHKDEQEFRQTGLELNPEDQPDCVEQSEDSNDVDETSCKVCATWLEHRDAAIASRVQYDQDRVISGDLVVSVDLEKVIQLPRMDRFKEVMFAKRIVALNETFAPLRGGQNGPVQAILWNETTSGRKAPDIMICFKPSVFQKKKTRPYLADIKEIRFDRGSYRLLYKEQFDGPWLQVDIFTKKQLKEITKTDFCLKDSVKWRTGNRGIETARKAHIVKKLCPLMAPEKVSFWTNLEECDNMDEFLVF
ncbi:hypothetical protein pipiens_004014 [Culex pipiens pipiens]|uniref:Uncharacterized protein n=1 Tax=Culex pipiens pipiens TaxID=38569 RepID=A0ABD1CPJ9_CULPP